MAQVLVTGGSGFIGSHVILRLLAEGHLPGSERWLDENGVSAPDAPLPPPGPEVWQRFRG